jgi:hypothetical protein
MLFQELCEETSYASRVVLIPASALLHENKEKQSTTTNYLEQAKREGGGREREKEKRKYSIHAMKQTPTVN